MATDISPIKQLRKALRDREYYLLAAHSGEEKSGVLAWLVYRQPRTGLTVVLQTFRDGSCELYKPVAKSNSVEYTIASIP